MSLLVNCRSCKKTDESKVIAGGLCPDCRILEAIKPEIKEMERLQSKANRYGSKGISLNQIRVQSLRIYKRAHAKALRIAIQAGDPKYLESFQVALNKAFESYMEKMEEPRIKIATAKDLLEAIQIDR